MQNTSQHTPGPWEISKHEDCEASIITAGHESIAFVYIDDNDKPATGINKADAFLISASPDLLAYAEFQKAVDLYNYDDAAYQILEKHGYTKDSHLTPHEFAVKMRQAAISKAKGE